MLIVISPFALQQALFVMFVTVSLDELSQIIINDSVLDWFLPPEWPNTIAQMLKSYIILNCLISILALQRKNDVNEINIMRTPNCDTWNNRE